MVDYQVSRFFFHLVHIKCAFIKLIYVTNNYNLLKKKQNNWNIRDDKRKANVLMTRNHKWRSFKNWLKRDFLANED